MEEATFNVAEAKAHLSAIIARVERGESITIARNNRPVAIITAVRKTADEIVADIGALRERVRADSGGRPVLEPGETWRDLIHAEHRL